MIVVSDADSYVQIGAYREIVIKYPLLSFLLLLEVVVHEAKRSCIWTVVSYLYL